MALQNSSSKEACSKSDISMNYDHPTKSSMVNELIKSPAQARNPSHMINFKPILSPIEKIKKQFENSLNLDPGSTVDVLFPHVAQLPNMNDNQIKDKNISQGFLSYNRRRFDEALTHFQRSLKGQQHRDNFVPRFVRGLCSFELGHYSAALTDFTTCCKEAVHQSRTKYEVALAFFNRSLTQIKLKNQVGTRKAMNDVNTAIEIYPTEPLFFTCRALLFRRLGCFEEAQRDYQMIRKLEAKAKAALANNDNTRGRCKMRQDTFIVSSHDKSLRSMMSMRSSSASSFGSVDLKTKLYGVVHTALTCCPSKRTMAQINLLVNESRMMAAFAHFDTPQLQTLWRYFEYKIYPSNTRIFEAGDVADDYYLVWSGSVSARINKRLSMIPHTSNVASALALEHELKVNMMTAGETLGEAILSVDGTRKASCVTEEPNTEIIILNRKHFDSTFHLFLDKIRKEKIEFLGEFDFLSDWDRELLDSLAQICRKKVFHSGDVIIKQDTSADSLYFIHTGMVSLIRTLTTCEVNLTTLSKGDVFGEASLTRDDLAVFPYSAHCDTMTICYRLDKIQINKTQWERLASKATSVTKFALPDDSTLIKSHLAEQKFKKQRDVFLSTLKKKNHSNSTNKLSR